MSVKIRIMWNLQTDTIEDRRQVQSRSNVQRKGVSCQLKVELCGTYRLRQLKTEDKSSEEVMYREREYHVSLSRIMWNLPSETEDKSSEK